jgi:hypothetical protein
LGQLYSHAIFIEELGEFHPKPDERKYGRSYSIQEKKDERTFPESKPRRSCGDDGRIVLGVRQNPCE